MDISKHYQGQQDYKTAIYFLTKALDVARLAGDVVLEADANQSLGLAQEKLGNIRAAIEYHETHRDLLLQAGAGSKSCQICWCELRDLVMLVMQLKDVF